MTSGGATGDPVLIGVLLVAAALVTVPVAGIAIVAYLRRRAWSYLFVSLALLALVARIGIAAGTVFGVVPEPVHHVAEHGLDVTIAALVVGAVLAARGIENPPTGERE